MIKEYIFGSCLSDLCINLLLASVTALIAGTVMFFLLMLGGLAGVVLMKMVS